MKSPFTGKPMIYAVREETVSYRSEEFTIQAHYYCCEESGEEVTTTEQDTLTVLQIHNQYRAKYNIPFRDEIIDLRERYGLNYSEMTEVLGFGPNTYKNYEKGEVPNKSNGKLLQVAKSETTFLELVRLTTTLPAGKKTQIITRIQALSQEGLSNKWYKVYPPKVNDQPSLHMGYRTFSVQKTGAVVAFLAKKLQPFTVQLNKLLFYADFGHYKRTGYSITGIPYKAIQMGPVPVFYKDLYAYLEYAEYVEAEEVPFSNGNSGTKYGAPVEEEILVTILTKEEQATLDAVIEQLGNDSTNTLIDKSHEEQAWQVHQADHSLITYDHAYFLKHL